MFPFFFRLMIGVAATGLATNAASAQMTGQMAAMPSAPEACAAPADLPAEMASWRTPAPLKAAGSAKASKAAQLTPGQAVAFALLPTPKVSYPLRPEKPGGSVSYGGLARFTVDQPGTWRVALGSGAWVDVVKDDKAAASIAHGHGPDCSGIRKMVDYSLTPGVYTLQVAANGADNITLLVTRLP